MDRDTDEWRRPWTTDDAGSPGDGSDRGARRVRRVTRPTPSTVQRAEADGATERPAGRTVTVRSRSDVPTGDPHPVADDRPPASPGPGAGLPEDSDVAARDGGDPAPRTGPRRSSMLAVAVVAALVGGVAGAGATWLADDRLASDAVDAGRSDESDAVRAPVVDSVQPMDGQTTVAAVAAAVLPSVVRIDAFTAEDDPDLGTVDRPIGVGSGVIYRSDGYILTNNHVVEQADSLEVQFSDNTKAVAEVIGTDRLTDLAVLKVEQDGLPAVNLRQDDPLEVGETAIAIGSPFGLDASVTAGVVSALNRDLEVPGNGDGAFVIAALIQTDAAINPGNSGGALVDASGQLIGINTAIFSGSGGSQGVGFAIPTRSAVIAAEQLIERGFVSHPFLGISGLDVTAEVESRYREDLGIELDGGALVDSVVEGSGADQGDIQSGDVIIELGGTEIASMTDVISAILAYDPGDVVPVVVLRDGERLELEVELGERPR